VISITLSWVSYVISVTDQLSHLFDSLLNQQTERKMKTQMQLMIGRGPNMLSAA